MKKTLALILTALLLLGSLSACGRKPEPIEPSASPEPTAPVEETPVPEDAPRDYSALAAALEGDTPVMTANGQEVKWKELYFWIQNVIQTIEVNLGPITDFNAPFTPDASQGSFRDYILTAAADTVSQYRALDDYARALEVTELSAESLERLELQVKTDMDYAGVQDEAAFEAFLKDMGMDREIYDYINRSVFLVDDCFTAAYGAQGEKCSDAEALAYAQQNDYIQAQHLLFSTRDETGESLSEEQKGEKLAAAENAREQLLAAGDRWAKMQELLPGSEDPGKTYYPKGYIFTRGRMMVEFETAAFALEEGNVSEVVETDAGYHVILRLPLNPDDPVEYYSAEESYSLRYMAASTLFDQAINGYMEAVKMERLPVLEALDFQSIVNGN